MKVSRAMGLGDVKMLAMIGAFLGWKQVGCALPRRITGAIVGIVILKSRGRSLDRLPFGTFLAVATDRINGRRRARRLVNGLYQC